MTPGEALALLDLRPGASPAALKAAFNAAAKAARPDFDGGDAERFRLVIEAYRLLEETGTRLAPAPRRAASTIPEFEISIDEAFAGVSRTVQVKGAKPMGVRLPPGMRSGDIVHRPGSGGGQGFRIKIVSEPNRAVLGCDLWITLPVDPHILEDGGRIEAETPYGKRNVWAPRGLPAEAMLRVKDCGLPPREGYPQGHAYLKLVPDAALTGSLARALLDRFAATWTPAERPAYRNGGIR
jgi:curved DNA-binding protein